MEDKKDTKDTKYQQKFTESDFTDILSENRIMTVAYIAKLMNCSTRTAKFYLTNLASAGKIIPILVDDGRVIGYKNK